jgi:hypothetical protein
VTGVSRRLLIALLTVLALLSAPATAALASARDVLDDCTDDEVMSKTYTQKEYKDALSQLAADADQYGNCREVISRAQLQAASAGRKKDHGGAPAGGGTSGGAGAIGSAPAAQQLADATPKERKAVDEARTGAGRPVQLDKVTVDPTKVGTAPGMSQASDLPTPLVVVLALLLLAALAAAAISIRNLVNARRA